MKVQGVGCGSGKGTRGIREGKDKRARRGADASRMGDKRVKRKKEQEWTRKGRRIKRKRKKGREERSKAGRK